MGTAFPDDAALTSGVVSTSLSWHRERQWAGVQTCNRSVLYSTCVVLSRLWCMHAPCTCCGAMVHTSRLIYCNASFLQAFLVPCAVPVTPWPVRFIVHVLQHPNDCFVYVRYGLRRRHRRTSHPDIRAVVGAFMRQMWTLPNRACLDPE